MGSIIAAEYIGANSIPVKYARVSYDGIPHAEQVKELAQLLASHSSESPINGTNTKILNEVVEIAIVEMEQKIQVSRQQGKVTEFPIQSGYLIQTKPDNTREFFVNYVVLLPGQSDIVRIFPGRKCIYRPSTLEKFVEKIKPKEQTQL